tara:strand:- start:63 stop:290 length:228 start_codon:yes stop_codon:yes gene_type:complete
MYLQQLIEKIKKSNTTDWNILIDEIFDEVDNKCLVKSDKKLTWIEFRSERLKSIDGKTYKEKLEIISQEWKKYKL